MVRANPGETLPWVAAPAPRSIVAMTNSPLRRRSLLIAAALGVGMLTTPAAATPTPADLPPVLQPVAHDLFPEGVAWDPAREALLVGSATSPARVSSVGADGVPRVVVSDPELPGFNGLKVDPDRNRIVATYGSPAVAGPTGLATYDATTGARVWVADLATDTPGEHGVNDVALDRDGTAYVTDSKAGAVYRVDLAGQVSTLVSDPRLGPAIGANGILVHPSGYLLVINYTTGGLFRIDPRTADLTEVWLPKPLIGGDGLALRPNGSLIVVTNALANLPGSSAAVHELRLLAGGRIAVPLRAQAWPDPAPTTVAVTPSGAYVVDGRLDVFLAGGSAEDFVLRRF